MTLIHTGESVGKCSRKSRRNSRDKSDLSLRAHHKQTSTNNVARDGNYSGPASHAGFLDPGGEVFDSSRMIVAQGRGDVSRFGVRTKKKKRYINVPRALASAVLPFFRERAFRPAAARSQHPHSVACFVLFLLLDECILRAMSVLLPSSVLPHSLFQGSLAPQRFQFFYFIFALTCPLGLFPLDRCCDSKAAVAKCGF